MITPEQIDELENYVFRMQKNHDGEFVIAAALLVLADRVYNLTGVETADDVTVLSESVLRMANKLCGEDN